MLHRDTSVNTECPTRQTSSSSKAWQASTNGYDEHDGTDLAMARQTWQPSARWSWSYRTHDDGHKHIIVTKLPSFSSATAIDYLSVHQPTGAGLVLPQGERRFRAHVAAASCLQAGPRPRRKSPHIRRLANCSLRPVVPLHRPPLVASRHGQSSIL